MILNFDENLIKIAKSLPAPLYAVGGIVRNAIIGGSPSSDVDLAAPFTVDELLPYLENAGAHVVAVYKRTGTIMFKCNGAKYEYTSFRKDEYGVGGDHTPNKTSFTRDIEQDARRRDFKCNAVYYDIARGEIVDPLNGAKDIKNKVLDTVVSPERVFGHDGLRLMRLARFSGELGFTPTDEVIKAARENAKNIVDISAERVFDELKKILVADEKYSFSSPDGHYIGLKILDDIRVLDYVLPELAEGRGMEQRADYHSHDVLEHSLRAVLYAPKKIRLAALFHDIAKPYCMNKYGRYKMHAVEGKPMAERALKRLKADNKTIDTVCFLVGAHMLDLDGDEPETDIRKFIVKNYPLIDDLLELKTADRRAYKDELTPPPVVNRWQKIIADINEKNIPLSLKGLKITAYELKGLGVKDVDLGKTLNALWDAVIETPTINEPRALSALATRLKDSIDNR